MSREERERRRERMLRLHAEGRAGAQFGKLGGRPRTKPTPVEAASARYRAEADEARARYVEWAKANTFTPTPESSPRDGPVAAPPKYVGIRVP